MMAMTTITGSVTAGTVFYFLKSYPLGWRICMAIPAVVLLMKVIVLSFLPESPRWLLALHTPAGMLSFTMSTCPSL
jgi:Sugar (and other) transporter